MKRIIFFGILILWTMSSNGQNLILNPSFEQNGKPDCSEWYPVCDAPFHVTCDSTTGCGVMIIQESAPDSLSGDWCLQTYGNFPFPGAVITYITGRSGTFIYQLNFWMKSEHFVGEVYLGVIENQVFTDPVVFTNLLQPWTLYTIRDTLTTSVSDTIGVQLGSAIGDFCICDVEYDQIELTIIDSLSTGVKEPSQQLYSIYPNPFDDQLNIHFPQSNGFSISIFDAMGRLINAEPITTDIGQIEMSSVPAGIYSYRIIPSGEPFQSYYGRLIKP